MSHQVGFGNILPVSDAATDAANSASGDLLPALNFGREKLLSSAEVEGKLKNWPTQEQASLKEQVDRSNPCRHPTTVSFVADASNQSSVALQFPIPRMQVRTFEMKMPTRWSDADDDEDTALPRMPWQTAAGSARPCIHGRVSPPAHLA